MSTSLTTSTSRSILKSLAYIGLSSPNLEAWATFARDTVGMQVDAAGDDAIRLRMDEKAHRYVIRRGEAGLAFLGFDVGSLQDLSRLERLLQERGTPCHRGSEAEARERAVQALLSTVDPDGHRVEFTVGLANASTEFEPGKPIGGFCTGELGVGHAVLYTPNYEAMSAFYQGLLEFRLTDFHHEPFPIEFLRINPRHHTLALLSDAGPARIHHLMIEYKFWDDVGRAYDLALAEPERIAVSLGRHLNDHVTSFYLWTPDKFFMEVGWAGRTIDDATWTPQEVAAPSLWGHVRYWQTPEKREQTRKMIAAVAARGERAPTAVRGEGFFTMPSSAIASAAAADAEAASPPLDPRSPRA